VRGEEREGGKEAAPEEGAALGLRRIARGCGRGSLGSEDR